MRGPQLGLKGHRIRLRGQLFAAGPLDLELVERTGGQAGHEQLPDPAFRALAHGMAAAVPAIEVADDADPRGARRPHAEGDAVDRVDGKRLRPQPVIELQVIALGEQVGIDLAEQQSERVGVVDLADTAVLGQAQAVGEAAPAADRPGKQPVVADPRQLGHDAAGLAVDDPHRRRLGLQRAHDDTRLTGMHAQQRERVAMLAPRQRGQLGRDRRLHGTRPPCRGRIVTRCYGTSLIIHAPCRAILTTENG